MKALTGNMRTASVFCGHWQFCIATRRDILFILILMACRTGQLMSIVTTDIASVLMVRSYLFGFLLEFVNLCLPVFVIYTIVLMAIQSPVMTNFRGSDNKDYITVINHSNFQ